MNELGNITLLLSCVWRKISLGQYLPISDLLVIFILDVTDLKNYPKQGFKNGIEIMWYTCSYVYKYTFPGS